MMFDVSNSSSTDRHTLCDTCRFRQEKKVRSKKVEIMTYCPKWMATVEGVGVCKYYEDINK